MPRPAVPATGLSAAQRRRRAGFHRGLL